MSSLVIIFLFGYFIGDFSPKKQSQLEYPEATFVIETDGINYRAIRYDGKIIFSSSNASDTINTAIKALTPNRNNYEKIMLKGSFTLNAPIQLPNFTFLDCEYAQITLEKWANCLMLKNIDFEKGNVEIIIKGGLWVGNNIFQAQSSSELFSSLYDYYGNVFFFYGIKNLTIENVFIQNSRAWAIRLQNCSNVKLTQIYFDNDALTSNEDGIHVQGPASNIKIDKVYGRTGDDMICLSCGAWEYYPEGPVAHGTVTQVSISNIKATDVRYGGMVKLFASFNIAGDIISNVTINNLVGTPRLGFVKILDHAVQGISITNVQGTVVSNSGESLPDPDYGLLIKGDQVNVSNVNFLIEGSADGILLGNLNRAEFHNVTLNNIGTGKSGIRADGSLTQCDFFNMELGSNLSPTTNLDSYGFKCSANVLLNSVTFSNSTFRNLGTAIFSNDEISENQMIFDDVTFENCFTNIN